MRTAFLLFVIISVATVSAERSLSKLKLIKTYLRNSIGQERLGNLAILSDEHSMGENLNFDVVISTFAQQKNPKKEILIIKILKVFILPRVAEFSL